MIQSWLSAKTENHPRGALEDLRGAHDQLAAMLAILGESLEALAGRYDSVRASDPPSVPEIEQFIGHAQAALHYQGRAGQLIELSLNRVTLAHGALKKVGASPNNPVPTEVWGAGIATCADFS